MKPLVTGGAGFIGSNLVEALVDSHEVTGSSASTPAAWITWNQSGKK